MVFLHYEISYELVGFLFLQIFYGSLSPDIKMETLAGEQTDYVFLNEKLLQKIFHNLESHNSREIFSHCVLKYGVQNVWMSDTV
jgi:hypothetical protein